MSKPAKPKVDKKTDSDTQVEIEEVENIKDAEQERQRREGRKDEWGLQFDIWLIRAAKSQKQLVLQLSAPLPGTGENVITVLPKRIDRDTIQVEYNGRDVWINKQFILSTEASE